VLIVEQASWSTEMFRVWRLSEVGTQACIAQELPETEKKTLTATQDPTAGTAFGAPAGAPAWKNKASGRP